MEISFESLIKKYNVPCPRYTSYPTVPYWDQDAFSYERWCASVRTAFSKFNKEGISLYIHLPYCESLCTYCGCNTRITVNHAVEESYIEAVLNEWKLYQELFSKKPLIREIHLGGGTPTFFSSENLEKLIQGILNAAEVSEKYSFSFEAHPNSTTAEHLKTLFNIGFRRLSLGIQDFDPIVQKTVNRIQTVEKVEEVVQNARGIDYESINFDLIYGLPFQTLSSVRNTIKEVIKMMPERIAFYSYAHVPWIKPGQRKFTEQDLPGDEDKRNLYLEGRKLLLAAGYKDIGMDHFALDSDMLYKNMLSGTLHRNFMGYTTEQSSFLLGLGVSSISDIWLAYGQNVKTIEEYKDKIGQGVIPVFKGHVLSDEDVILRKHILNIMCQYQTDWSDANMQSQGLFDSLERLSELEKDGFVKVVGSQLTVLEQGKPFLRNICMAFDERLWQKTSEKSIFSSSI